MAWKTILADDHQLFRQGLRALLSGCKEVEVIGEASNGLEALALCEKLHPDLVIIDPSMPELNGIEAAARIRQEFPSTRIVALSMHSDRRFVSSMLGAGASAYLLKTYDEKELFQAIALVMEGKTYLSPDMAGLVVEEMANPSEAGTPLSGREREILQLMAEGKSAKEIGLRMNVSSRTIDSHRQHIMAKLNIFTVAELTKYAVKHGITPL